MLFIYACMIYLYIYINEIRQGPGNGIYNIMHQKLFYNFDGKLFF